MLINDCLGAGFEGAMRVGGMLLIVNAYAIGAPGLCLSAAQKMVLGCDIGIARRAMIPAIRAKKARDVTASYARL